jgi:signal peptide peptidase SppA
MPLASPPAPGSRLARLLPWRRRPPVIPAIRLHGVIGSIPLRGRGLTITSLSRALGTAFAQKRAPAVILLVNSPGGSAAQSSLIARRIRDLAAERNRPVLAFVEDVAASGGYWLACAADEIFADPASIVGSIGVVSQGFGLHEAIARLGIERRVHTAGRRKALLDPFRPEQPEDIALLKELQGDLHELFKAQVRERRAGKLNAPEDELFDGRVWTAAKAKAAGLIDALGDPWSVVRERFGKKAVIRVVNEPRSWLARRLGGGADVAQDPIATALASIEERLYYARYGL